MYSSVNTSIVCYLSYQSIIIEYKNFVLFCATLCSMSVILIKIREKKNLCESFLLKLSHLFASIWFWFKICVQSARVYTGLVLPNEVI